MNRLLIFVFLFLAISLAGYRYSHNKRTPIEKPVFSQAEGLRPTPPAIKNFNDLDGLLLFTLRPPVYSGEFVIDNPPAHAHHHEQVIPLPWMPQSEHSSGVEFDMLNRFSLSQGGAFDDTPMYRSFTITFEIPLEEFKKLEKK